MRNRNAKLLPDERVLFQTKKHVIIFFYPLIWTLVVALVVALVVPPQFFSTMMEQLRLPAILNPMLFIWGSVAVFWGYIWLQYAVSEFIVTNKRLIMREGFFNRHIQELRLPTISQVNVDQSLVGQLLDYGIVSVNAFGVYDSFTVIAKPNQFQQKVNEQLDSLTKT